MSTSPLQLSHSAMRRPRGRCWDNFFKGAIQLTASLTLARMCLTWARRRWSWRWQRRRERLRWWTQRRTLCRLRSIYSQYICTYAHHLHFLSLFLARIAERAYNSINRRRSRQWWRWWTSQRWRRSWRKRTRWLLRFRIFRFYHLDLKIAKAPESKVPWNLVGLGVGVGGAFLLLVICSRHHSPNIIFILWKQVKWYQEYCAIALQVGVAAGLAVCLVRRRKKSKKEEEDGGGTIEA